MNQLLKFDDLPREFERGIHLSEVSEVALCMDGEGNRYLLIIFKDGGCQPVPYTPGNVAEAQKTGRYNDRILVQRSETKILPKNVALARIVVAYDSDKNFIAIAITRDGKTFITRSKTRVENHLVNGVSVVQKSARKSVMIALRHSKGVMPVPVSAPIKVPAKSPLQNPR